MVVGPGGLRETKKPQAAPAAKLVLTAGYSNRNAQSAALVK
jgi:hypothetical protein